MPLFCRTRVRLVLTSEAIIITMAFWLFRPVCNPNPNIHYIMLRSYLPNVLEKVNQDPLQLSRAAFPTIHNKQSDDTQGISFLAIARLLPLDTSFTFVSNILES